MANSVGLAIDESALISDSLEPFKKLAATIKERFDAVVRGMLDHRSDAFVESMNGQLQQAKRAARGYRTAKNFIAIAYLRLSRLKNLPPHPFSATTAVSGGCRVPQETA
jgi:transposase